MIDLDAEFNEKDIVEQAMDRVFKVYEKRVQSVWKECVDQANKEILKGLSSEIKKKYNEAMEQFYSDYSGRKKYQPRKSLLDRIQTTDDIANNRVFFDIPEDDLIGPDRRGNDSLARFKKIWDEGYHGGATQGDYTRIKKTGEEIYTPHPNPGTPYYRKGPYYLSWGREAVKTTPPAELWAKKKKELEEEATKKRNDLAMSLLEKNRGRIFRA